MLTYKTTLTSIDESGTADPYMDPTTDMTFEAPNLQVALAFISAFNAIDASTWSDHHSSLGWEPQIVDGPSDDHWTWDDIQQDRSLSSEMAFWPQSTVVA